MNRNQRFYALCGVIAPLLFTFMALLGGALRPGYSHIQHTVSELLSPGSPNRLLLSILFALYAILFTLFGYGVFRFVRQSGQARPGGLIGATLLIVAGCVTFFTATIFPQDPWGTPLTFPGRMHLVLSGVIGILAMLAYLLLGIWFRRSGISPGLGLFSLIIVAASIASTLIFVASANTPTMGLGERIAVFFGLLWTFTMGLWLM